MKVLTGISTRPNVEHAVNEAVSSFGVPKMIIFFSAATAFAEISEKISARYPHALVLGTTSYYTYFNQNISQNALTVISFEDDIDCSGGVIEEIKRYPLKYVSRVKNAVDMLPPSFIGTENTICLEFATAFSLSEELVLATLNSICGEYDIPVIGGTAGVSPLEAMAGSGTTYVSLNGKVYEDACIFAFIRNKKGRIKLFKENIYKPTSKSFMTTSVDVQHRIIRTLDNMPVADVLQKALKCTKEHLPQLLSESPIGRIVGNEIYISDYAGIYDDGSIGWSTRIYNNTKIILLKPGDLKKETQETLNRIIKDVPHPSFTFIIHCLARTMYYEKMNYLADYVSTVAAKLGNVSGFSSMGEQLRNHHLNQTMLAVVFE